MKAGPPFPQKAAHPRVRAGQVCALLACALQLTAFVLAVLAMAGPATAQEVQDDGLRGSIGVPVPGAPAPAETPDMPLPADGDDAIPVSAFPSIYSTTLDAPMASGTNAPQRLARRRLKTEDDAYAPLGIRAGGFLLRPGSEVSGGYDSNPGRVKHGKGSAYMQSTSELAFESDWARHSLSGLLRGGYTAYDKYSEFNAPGFEGDVTGRFDASRTTQFTLGLRGSVESEAPGDPETPNGLKESTLIYGFGGTAGATWKPNRFSATLETLADRFVYQDGKLKDGGEVDNGDRDYTAYEVRLRGGYDVSLALEPFVEVSGDRRIHDRSRDRNGINRDSTGVTGSIGARFIPDELISAEGKIGYRFQHPDDDSLENLTGLVLAGSLVWKATPLTTVRLTADTAFDETTFADSPGAVTHTASLEVEHSLRRNLIATARLRGERTDYKGDSRTDTAYTAELGLEYRLTRSFALTARAAHEHLHSSEPDDGYTDDRVEVGVKVRR